MGGAVPSCPSRNRAGCILNGYAPSCDQGRSRSFLTGCGGIRATAPSSSACRRPRTPPSSPGERIRRVPPPRSAREPLSAEHSPSRAAGRRPCRAPTSQRRRTRRSHAWSATPTTKAPKGIDPPFQRPSAIGATDISHASGRRRPAAACSANQRPAMTRSGAEITVIGSLTMASSEFLAISSAPAEDRWAVTPLSNTCCSCGAITAS